jgi:hypothetical protein
MEGDSTTRENKKEISGCLSDIGDLLQSVGIRRFVRSDYEVDRVLLDYGFNFLLPFSMFLWVLFLALS